MAYIQYILMVLSLLAFTIQTQFAEGRQLKAMKEPELRPVKIETGLQNHAKKAINVQNHQNNLQVTGEKKISPPSQSHESSSLDDIEQTKPGNSPGIGHSFAAQKDNTQQKKVQHFTSGAGKTDGYQLQGHSPGVGHSVGNLKAGPKA